MDLLPISYDGVSWLPFFSLLCLIPIVWFIIGILLCIWVYRDAESRGMNGGIWVIITIVGGIVGLIVYLIVRKERTAPTPPPPPILPPTTRFCPSCGREVAPGAEFCPNCGKHL